MPINQDKLVNILKAGAYYRMAYQQLFDQVKREWELAQDNQLNMPLPSYILRIREVMQEVTNQLNPTYGQYIEAGLQQYTPAKLRRNEKVKEYLRKKRDQENPNRKPRKQDSIISDGLPAMSKPAIEKIPNQLAEGISKDAFREMMIRMGADPDYKGPIDDDEVWPPPGESINHE